MNLNSIVYCFHGAWIRFPLSITSRQKIYGVAQPQKDIAIRAGVSGEEKIMHFSFTLIARVQIPSFFSKRTEDLSHGSQIPSRNPVSRPYNKRLFEFLVWIDEIHEMT